VSFPLRLLRVGASMLARRLLRAPPRALILPPRLAVASPFARHLCAAKPAPESGSAEGAAKPADAAGADPISTEETGGAGETTVDPRLGELEARVAELDEQLKAKHDQLLRAMADADNARRRAAIDVESANKYGVGKFAKAMLEVADNLGRAADSVPEEARSSDEQPALRALYEGVILTDAALHKAFKQHGLERMSPLGQKFDPNMHEALFEVPDPSKEPGTVAHVTSAGYVLHDRCLRAAGVGITSKPPV